MPEHFNESDTPRLKRQMETIRELMLIESANGYWHTLEEIAQVSKIFHPPHGYPPASISAQLRHLRKPRYGGYAVEKRPRGDRG